ncbi:MAG TPA: HAD family hydrolase [Mycobacteriales bacterium]|nr:HAD family hydrolase [Mycobacteriales bacterium]
MSCDAAIFDVDGTLVDSNYQHALAWYRAFRRVQTTLPIWRIHRHVGIGGDRIVTALAGEEFEQRHGDEVRRAHDEEFGQLIDEVAALDGAHELLVAMADRGVELTVASSGNAETTDRLLALVGAGELLHAVVTSADVDSSKPAPDLVQRARAAVGAYRPLMIGDAVWDAQAAVQASIPFVALRTGGFSESELAGAGAMAVYHSPHDLLDHLDEWMRTTPAP